VSIDQNPKPTEPNQKTALGYLRQTPSKENTGVIEPSSLALLELIFLKPASQTVTVILCTVTRYTPGDRFTQVQLSYS
jgi:hypothetical protein